MQTDWASSLARRASQKPPADWGWNIFFIAGAAPEFADPSANLVLRGTGRTGWPGWFDDKRMEELRRVWLLEMDPERRYVMASEMQAKTFATMPYVPLGQYRLATAYRRSITGIVPSVAPLFWSLEVG